MCMGRVDWKGTIVQVARGRRRRRRVCGGAGLRWRFGRGERGGGRLGLGGMRNTYRLWRRKELLDTAPCRGIRTRCFLCSGFD